MNLYGAGSSSDNVTPVNNNQMSNSLTSPLDGLNFNTGANT